jgi:hypothetical protein
LLGRKGKDNLGCAISLNNEGWTEIMAQNVEAGQVEHFRETSKRMRGVNRRDHASARKATWTACGLGRNVFRLKVNNRTTKH